jgi:N-acetyl-anhydromuramyl-L-alanine amidase AmpD
MSLEKLEAELKEKKATLARTTRKLVTGENPRWTKLHDTIGRLEHTIQKKEYTLKHSKTRKNYEPITVRSSKLKKYGYPLIGLLTVAAAAGGIAYVAKGF